MGFDNRQAMVGIVIALQPLGLSDPVAAPAPRRTPGLRRRGTTEVRDGSRKHASKQGAPDSRSVREDSPAARRAS